MRHAFSSKARPDGAWPALLLLLVAVLAPTACVLWFMNEAIRSQRHVVQQRLTEAYHSHLMLLRDRMEEYVGRRTADLEGCAQETSGSTAFARCLSLGLGDSVIILRSNGQSVYPNPAMALPSEPTYNRQDWVQARGFEEQDPIRAAAAYGSIAASDSDTRIRALAFQAQGRTLLLAGQKNAAVEVATKRLAARQYERTTDLQGRLIVADAQLMALQLLRNPKDPHFGQAAFRLRQLLLDYDNPALSAPQRLFLMTEMQSLDVPAELKLFPTMEAESLAARFLEVEPAPMADGALRSSSLPDIWKLGSSGVHALALYRTATVTAQFRHFLSIQNLPSDLEADILSPGVLMPNPEAMSMPGGSRLPGWMLTLSVKSGLPFGHLDERQMTIYLWTGAVTIATVAILVILASRAIRRQARLARLKTDLVATVSHELKTPVSSMRLLVDTLLEEEDLDLQRTREYLQLIARENTRLSRLIDNFLTFSRMERNKQAFDFRSTQPAAVLDVVSEAVRERFASSDCRLDVEVGPGLQPVHADEDALVTMLLNLIDNAFKYSQDDSRVALRAFTSSGKMCFEVEDHGIGMSPADSKKIFQKFYQVDQRLSRRVGGVGLGLSIVHYIVEAHSGSIQLETSPGKGTKFTISLPAVLLHHKVIA